jgi:signal transduction histidine kinase
VKAVNTFTISEDLSIAHALTWRYVIALLLVAALSTAAWISLHLVISEQQSTAAVVNVSGRQRMLSQRTALFSNLLVNAPRPQREQIRAKLKQAIELMERSHRGLTHGDASMGLPATLSPAVQALYFGGDNPLDQQVESYIEMLKILLTEQDAALNQDNPRLRYIIETAPTTLVASLDEMVRLYQAEGEASVTRLQKAETIFWVVTLLLLTLEALLIFRPFVRHVRSIISKLQQVSDELKSHQGHLEELVKQRTLELENQGKALQRSNADLERFAYSVSHDMRQPLRAVSGHLQLLKLALKDTLDAENSENLQFALQGAKRMDSMIVSLLEYSRIGRTTQAKEWIESKEFLDEALGFLQPAILQAKAVVDVQGEWPQVFASRDELPRLMQNLIGNALHYHEAGQVPHIEITSRVSKNSWQVSVHDHGIGIDPRQIERLFQFFSRLQSRDKFEGTGMGLALCRRIVEHHGGKIWVESEGEGKGSTFIFELPLVVEQSK